MKTVKSSMVREISFDRLGEIPAHALRWSREGLHATAAIAEEGGKRLWVGSAEGGLRCLDSASDREFWKADVSKSPIVGVLLHGTWLIAWDSNGGVFWCDHATGKPSGSFFSDTGLAGPPFCAGDWMVFGTKGGEVMRFDLRKPSGAVWTKKAPQGLRLAPVGDIASVRVSEQGEGLLLAGISGSGQLLAWEAESGTAILSRDIGAKDAVAVEIFENTDIFVMDRNGYGETWSYMETSEAWQAKSRDSGFRAHVLRGVTHSVPVWRSFQEYVLGTVYGEVVRRSITEEQDRWRVQMPDPLLQLERRDGYLIVCGRAGSVVCLDIWKGRPLRAFRLPRTPHFVRVLADGGLLASDTSGGLSWYRGGWWKRAPNTTTTRRQATQQTQPKPSDTPPRKTSPSPRSQTKAAPQTKATSQTKAGPTQLFWLKWEGKDRLVPADSIPSTTSGTTNRKTPTDPHASVGIEVLCEQLSDSKLSAGASRRLLEIGPEAMASLWPELSSAGMLARVTIQDTLHKIADRHKVDLLGAWTERCMSLLFHPPALVPMLEMLLFWPNPNEAEIADALLPLQGLCEAPTDELKSAWQRLQARYPSLQFDFFSPPTDEQAAKTAVRKTRSLRASQNSPAWKTAHGQADAQDTGYYPDRQGPTSAYTSAVWFGTWCEGVKRKEQVKSPKTLSQEGVVVVLHPSGSDLTAWEFLTRARMGMLPRWSWQPTRALSNFALWEDAVLVRYEDQTLDLLRPETGEILWQSDLKRDINLLLPERDSLYTLRQERNKWLLRAERMKSLWGLEKAWEVTLGEQRPSTLILSRQGDLVVNCAEGTFRAHRAEDGAFVYEKTYPTWGRCWLIGAEEGVLFANAAGHYGCLDAQGEVLWQANAEQTLGGAPVYAEGMMYLTTEGGDVRYVDAQTGQIRHTYKAWGPLGGAVIAGNTLFVCDENQVYALHRQINEELWRKKLPEQVSWRPPVVWDHKVLVFDRKGKMHLFGA